MSDFRESADFMTSQWMPQIDLSACTGCGDCIALCPVGALGLQAGKTALTHPEHCTYCVLCEDVCPVGAIGLPYLIIRAEPKDDVEL